MSAPQLVTVRPGLTLTPDAAASWVRMETELGRTLDVNRSYADWDAQMDFYEAYQRYLNGGPWAPLALHPSESWHCRGLAVDTDDDRVIREMPAYGWRFVVRIEEWHAQYYAYLDQYRGQRPAGLPPRPLPTQKDEESMLFITYRTRDGARVYARVMDDAAQREPLKTAQAWNSARGGERHQSVTLAEAHRIFTSVRETRSRRVGAITDAVSRELDQLLAEIGDVADEPTPDDGA